jgi:hypothetical protein
MPEYTLPQDVSLEDQLDDASARSRAEIARQVVRSLLCDLHGDESAHLELILEIENARAVLRRLCEDHGDNDWPDDLALSDILDKHLGYYLNRATETSHPQGAEGGTAEDQNDARPQKEGAASEYPDREGLIDLCERGHVEQRFWENRDSAQAQIQQATCAALLKAGCDFEIDQESSSDDTIHLRLAFHGFNFFEVEVIEYQSFYIPTAKLLDAAAGGDWY